MYYATLDSDGTRISENANIVKFATLDDAEKFLRDAYKHSDYDISVGVGEFGDCWIKTLSAPTVGDATLKPFSYAQLNILQPGQHPGGRMWWITPVPEVMVAVAIPRDE